MYTEKFVNTVKEYDPIMIKIKEEKEKYEMKQVEAYIENDKIIPGLSGMEVDENKSYSKMKQYGKYDERLYEYKKIPPKNRLIDNKDKLIIKGNNKKNMVSLVILKSTNLEKLIDIANQNNIKLNIFENNNFYKKNKKYILKLSLENHLFGSLDGNCELIKSLIHQRNNYCYLSDNNIKIKNECANNGAYLIYSNLILNNENFFKLKKEISKGSIIVIDEITSENFMFIINHIKNKGYDIVTLNQLLEE